jgi:hypothetical protein
VVGARHRHHGGLRDVSRTPRRAGRAAAAQKFLAAEIQRDVEKAVGDVEPTEAHILDELGRVRDQLDRLTAVLERRRDG